MFDNVDFSQNTRGTMREYKDVGPFVHLLATDLGQMGMQRDEVDGTPIYRLHVEPFSRKSAKLLSRGLGGWAGCGTRDGANWTCFSLETCQYSVWLDNLEAAIGALLAGDGKVYTWSKPGNQIVWLEELVSRIRSSRSSKLRAAVWVN